MCFAVEAGLLERVHSIPHESLQHLDARLTLRDGGIVARPLADERRARAVIVEQANEEVIAPTLLASWLARRSVASTLVSTVRGSTAQNARASSSASSKGT